MEPNTCPNKLKLGYDYNLHNKCGNPHHCSNTIHEKCRVLYSSLNDKNLTQVSSKDLERIKNYKIVFII